MLPEQALQVDNKDYWRGPGSEKSEDLFFSWIWQSSGTHTYNF